jgi:hypothetical protein
MVRKDSEGSGAYSSPEPARRVPCVQDQTCCLFVGWLVKGVFWKVLGCVEVEFVADV